MRSCQVMSLLVLAIVLCVSSTSAREINHEDIRDAILSLINMFRGNTDKLERHELRERALGEQLKKALAGLDKRQETAESTLTAAFQTLESRLVALEGVVSAKSQESSPDLKPMIEELVRRTESNAVNADSGNSQRIDELNAKVDRMEAMLANMAEVIAKNTATPSEVDIIAKSGGRYMYTTSDIESRLDEQMTLLQGMNTKLNTGITINDLQEMSNNSQTLLQEVKYELLASSDRNILKLDDQMVTIGKQMKQDRDNLVKSITEISERTEELYGDIQRSYDQLLKEVKGLVKVEEVLIQTADNVLDTKRRIEYGTHQILVEVGDLIKTQSKDLNDTVNSRFDIISQTILDNQNGGLTNLSSKIETEISQVWRQIGIMYQTLTSSAQALDRLQQQTEIYVNGSLSTMDNMEGKVGQITGRMGEVDENLNYLLGKLSLVTHEFNQIKSGLGEALDNIRSSFQVVQSKVKQVEELGPAGPNPIPEELDDSVLSKTRYSTS
ncbi:hypothetical protein M8J77_008860 [Diaphorina citri]|nr:hypothetical protein M8J77_008860 [Diaphorina citri]